MDSRQIDDGDDRMIVMVTGSRSHEDMNLIRKTLDGIEISMLIEGGATGADALAKSWARLKGVPVATVEADWHRHGKAAGPLRNGWMLDLKPDLVVAFPEPGSRGTWDAINQAKSRGIEVKIVLPDGSASSPYDPTVVGY